MKRFLYLILVLLLTYCSSKTVEDPLILPPNFSEIPDLSNPDKPTEQQKEEGVSKLKELLLQSDE